MRKVLSLVLAVSVSAMLLASCGNSNVDETTTLETTTLEATTANSEPENTLNTTGSSTTETTAIEESTTEDTTTTTTTRVSLVEGVVDTYEHDYIVKLIEDVDTHEIVGAAVCYWESDKVTTDIVFDEIFTYRDAVGKQHSYPIIQIGYGQGIVPFQASVVKTISVPSTVKRIYANSFSGYPNLKTVTLSHGLEEIGSMAFWYNTSLEEIIIPSSVTSIGDYAFADCTNLKKVTLPRVFEDRIGAIFENCPNAEFTYVD